VDGARALAAALHINERMKVLILTRNRIGSGGAVALADALAKSKTMMVLDVCGNDIGDEGAEALAAAVATNPRMTSLSLSENSIRDRGGLALAAALVKSRSLKTLNMDSNYDITEVCVRDLADSAARSWRLAELSLAGVARHNVSEEALARAMHNRRLLALQGALCGPPTPARRFVSADGDFALGHRIAGFLLEDEIPSGV
jgi:Ran GTPase-activating protein (RanGAP) involved in mRNA processing and transport